MLRMIEWSLRRMYHRPELPVDIYWRCYRRERFTQLVPHFVAGKPGSVILPELAGFFDTCREHFLLSVVESKLQDLLV